MVKGEAEAVAVFEESSGDEELGQVVEAQREPMRVKMLMNLGTLAATIVNLHEDELTQLLQARQCYKSFLTHSGVWKNCKRPEN